MISTRQSEILAVVPRDEWLSAHTIKKMADVTSAYEPLKRLLALGLVERDASVWPHLWRRTGASVRFNDGGQPWEVACASFEAADDLGPLPEDICGTCGRHFAHHQTISQAGVR